MKKKSLLGIEDFLVARVSVCKWHVIIRDSFGKTVAAMNKIHPSAYTAEATEAFALQQGGSCLLLKW